MLELHTTGQFRKDYKRIKKRGLNLGLLEQVIDTLLEEKPLALKYRDHALTGDYIGYRECHIQPDWLLMYLKEEDILVLTLVDTGTHADLFDM